MHRVITALCALGAVVGYSLSAQTTWYVRSDGGTRFSTSVPLGQCNGTTNSSYLGTGTNQNCAYSDIRYLWTDGTSGSWGWVGAGGDTYLISCPSDCRVGYSGPNNTPSDYFLGVPGDPFGSGAPVPHNGTSGAHTKILGVNFASCSSDSVKAHVNGGYGVLSVFNLKGSSYVDMACLNITDHSSCGRQGQTNACSSSFPLSDYATNGITTSNTTTNTTVTDVTVHGVASSGMLGATGTGVSVLRVALVGNASSGWNMDDGSGATGTGILNMDYFSVLWNGCAEEYPIVDATPYQDCTDDSSGGYGDGIGTATTTSSPAWIMTITNSVAAYNTQDGFDLLHLQGGGSTLNISTSQAYSNMGQQLKVGSASVARNNMFFGNCNALRQDIPGTPSGYNSRLSDFCRAADTAVVMEVQDSLPTVFEFNTLYSANATAFEIDCNPAAPCTSAAQMVFEDNIYLGFLNNLANGYPSGGSGVYPGPIANSVSGLFSNAGSLLNSNVFFHFKSSWSCPNTSFNETNAHCVDPQLVNGTWPLYGIVSMLPTSATPAGVPIAGVTTDFSGRTRSSSAPTIGANEFAPIPNIGMVGGINAVGSVSIP